MKKRYLICQKLICIESDSFPGDNPMWTQFESWGKTADINIRCKVCELFPEASGEFKGNAGEFRIHVDGSTVYRELPMGTEHGALTRYTTDTSFSESFFTPRSFPIMMDSRYMWSSLSLAQLLLSQNAFFIHSSFIDIGGKALLFSAPCGTGKSTQADLWQKHRNAEIINGDKAGILVEDKVYACGVPFCGTSGICQNRTLPLGAIVFLSQSPQNTVTKLSGPDALQNLMRNTYLDFLAPDEQRLFVDLVIEILSSVPVFSFACTPTRDAVNTLENILKAEGVV